ncbi:hypothetical protein FOZ63_016577, partial [Perkinsus olseni]
GPGSLLTDPIAESGALAATHLPAGADPFVERGLKSECSSNGDYDTLKLQWNIVEGDTSPTGSSMEASGNTQLSLGTESGLHQADAVASAGHSYSTRHALVVTQLSHDGYHIRFSFGAKGTYVTSEG